MPNLLNLTNPPTVTIRVGEPVELKYRSPAADTTRIMSAIGARLPPEAREKRVPSADELRAGLSERATPRREVSTRHTPCVCGGGG